MTFALLAALALGQSPEQMERWVKDLGSEEFKVRDEADKALRAAGKAALPYLEKALKSEDLEIRERAEAIKKFIVKPEAPKKEAPREEADPVPGGLHVRVHVVGGDPYELKIDPDGVELKKDGKTYKAPSAEAFRKEYPDLYEKYVKPNTGGVRVQVRAVRPEVFQFRRPLRKDPPPEPEDPLFGLGREDLLEELFKNIFRDDQEIEKLLQGMKQRIERDRRELERYSREFADRFRRELEGKPAKEPAAADLGLVLGEIDDELRAKNKLGEDEGIRILSVKPKSICARLGLRADDILLRVGAGRIRNTMQARSELTKALAGDEVVVEILRAGERKALKARSDDLKGF